MTETLTNEVVEATPATGLLSPLAARLRCTEGQLYSMVISLTAASALVLGGGVPLGDAPRVEAAPLPSASPVVVAPPPTAPGPLEPLPLQPLGPGTAVPPGMPVVPEPPAFEPPAPPVQGPRAQDLQVPAPGLPRALVADALHVYAGTDNPSGTPSRLYEFSRTGDPSRVFTVSGQPKDHAGGLSAAALHGSTVLVTDRSRGALLEIDPRTGSQQVLATLPDLPACLIGIAGTCQPGAEDLPATPEGVAVTAEYAYVADAAQGTIWRYAFATKQLTAWYTSSDFSSSGPSGLAVAADGDLVLTVAESADPEALLRGALYRLEVAADGTAGERSLLASFAPEDGVGPVAVGRSGVYVGLRSNGGVVLVKTDGTTAPVATSVQVLAPGGLSLVEGILYVADAGLPATANSGVVRALSVTDGPAA